MSITSYAITGTLTRDEPGANIWDWIPAIFNANSRRFANKPDAIRWASIHSAGPDQDGLDVVWDAEEVTE